MSLQNGGAVGIFIQSDGNPSMEPEIMGPICRDNRQRFVKNLKEIAGITEGAVYLKGGNMR